MRGDGPWPGRGEGDAARRVRRALRGCGSPRPGLRLSPFRREHGRAATAARHRAPARGLGRRGRVRPRPSRGRPGAHRPVGIVAFRWSCDRGGRPCAPRGGDRAGAAPRRSGVGPGDEAHPRAEADRARAGRCRWQVARSLAALHPRLRGAWRARGDDGTRSGRLPRARPARAGLRPAPSGPLRAGGRPLFPGTRAAAPRCPDAVAARPPRQDDPTWPHEVRATLSHDDGAGSRHGPLRALRRRAVRGLRRRAARFPRPDGRCSDSPGPDHRHHRCGRWDRARDGAAVRGHGVDRLCHRRQHGRPRCARSGSWASGTPTPRWT